MNPTQLLSTPTEALLKGWKTNSSAQEAFKRLQSERLKYLPVVDEHNRLQGLVTRTAMVNALASVVWGERNEEENGE
ncbi:MAG: CBS domain-containing protein [Clostridia bacterium]|nr:CBS domain-containing protein [Clostridia bacterium]